MFAPITRSYSTSFAASKGRAKLPPFRRNKLEFPADPRVNLAFLGAWQKMFKGDSFDFDYHFMWDHFKDPGYYALAEILHQDLRGFREIGINGFNSCQVQRAFFPTGLGMTAMARTLWDRDVTFDQIADDYFTASLGKRGKDAAEYLARLSELFDPRVLRLELSDKERQKAVARYGEIPLLVEDFLPAIRTGMRLSNPTHARSWIYLNYHRELCLLLCEAIVGHVGGDAAAAKASGLELVEWARRNERHLHRVFDVNLFLKVIPPLIGLAAEDLG